MKRYGALLVVLGSALWGTDALFRRPLTASLSPVTIVLLEHCLLALVMLPVLARYRAEFRRLKRRDYAALLFIALGGSVAATSLFTFAVKYGNPSVVILLLKAQPLFSVLLARIFLGERPARRFWPWLALAIAGAYLMSEPDWSAGLQLSPGHPVVILSAIGAAALWGSATVCGRYVVPRIPTLFLTALRFIFALPALAILFWLQPANQRVLPAGITPVLNVAGMALIAGLAALLLYYRGLKSITASLASVCELSFPVAAVALNRIVLGVHLSSLQFLGSAVLITSVTTLAALNANERGRTRPDDPKLIRS